MKKETKQKQKAGARMTMKSPSGHDQKKGDNRSENNNHESDATQNRLRERFP